MINRSSLVCGVSFAVILSFNVHGESVIKQYRESFPQIGEGILRPIKEMPFYLREDICDGFPVNLSAPGAGFPYTPTLFDADNDGAAEIFLTGGNTFGLRGDGTFLPGWPTQDHQYMGYGTNACKPGPSAADLEDDGSVEVMWSERDWWAGSSQMWCFNGREFDGSNMSGLPQFAPDDYSNALDTPFVYGDTDSDGNLEAWSAHTLGNAFIHYRISAISHSGVRLFTVDLNPNENILSLYYGDLEGDGISEMFGVSWLDPSIYLHAFNSDGSEKTGYPVLLHTLSSGNLTFGPPIPFDLDNDSDLEILFGHWGGGTSHAQCIHHTGNSCTGFPIQIATSSQLFYLGLGDLTGDGEPELLALDNHLGGAYRAIAFNMMTGLMLPGWPYSVPHWPHGFPGVADIDGDGAQDMIFSTDGGEVYAVHGDGSLISGYPKTMASPSISGVAIGDIDGDNLFEIVASTWDGFVYAWNTPAPVQTADWPMRGVDARNTGVYGGIPVPCPADLTGDDQVNIDDIFAVLGLWGDCPDPCPPYCLGDLTEDCAVNIDDIFAILGMWGLCE